MDYGLSVRKISSVLEYTNHIALNTYINSNLSSTVLNETIKANDVWAFYQAKSIKQTVLDIAADNVTDHNLQLKYRELANRYESDKKTGEGKKELLEKARIIRLPARLLNLSIT